MAVRIEVDHLLNRFTGGRAVAPARPTECHYAIGVTASGRLKVRRIQATLCRDHARARQESPLVTIDADTVVRAVVRAVEAKNPKPRYIVGASGKASVLARLLLSDQMWIVS